MSNVVKLVCLKVRSALLEFQKTKSVPKLMINGDITLSDISSCMSNFNDDEIIQLKKMQGLYKNYCITNKKRFKANLRAEYADAIINFKTRDPDFIFEDIMSAYRKDINPVSALCNELNRMSKSYDPDNLYHQWLIDLVTGKEMNKKLYNALKTDIFVLDNILNKYNLLFSVDSSQIPLELFHAKQKIKEFEKNMEELSKFAPHFFVE